MCLFSTIVSSWFRSSSHNRSLLGRTSNSVLVVSLFLRGSSVLTTSTIVHTESSTVSEDFTQKGLQSFRKLKAPFGYYVGHCEAFRFPESCRLPTTPLSAPGDRSPHPPTAPETRRRCGTRGGRAAGRCLGGGRVVVVGSGGDGIPKRFPTEVSTWDSP